MKYLVLGVNGMAGHVIAEYLIEKGNEVIGFARDQSIICPTIVGDACCPEKLFAALNDDSYDVVVNCIGILNKQVDRNPAVGIYLNSVFPHVVAAQVESKSCKLIHISTDCVFTGQRGGYIEKDIPDEYSMYGRSKALGEVIYGNCLTLRTSIIGPELKRNGIGLFHWFMSQSCPVKGYTKTMWTGVTTLQLAKAVEKAGESDVCGLYHLVNNEEISKYDLLQLFNRFCRFPQIKIENDDTIVSKKTLLNTRADFEFHIPSYEDMISEMGEWIKVHQKFYTQYQTEGII